VIREHLPVLQIVVPLMAAPLCVLIRERILVLCCTITVCWSTFLTSVALLVTVWRSPAGEISYPLGNWPAPWGIQYRVDTLGAFVLLLVSAMGAAVISYAPRSVEREIPADRHYLFYALYLLALTGLLGIAITGDLFNLFVFLEISSLSSYALISVGSSRRALTAAFQYLVIGTIAATFILIGIGLIYQMTGSLTIVDIASRLKTFDGPRTVLVAFAFLSVGISIKMALFPLHFWLPNAYTYAPSVVSALLAATATKVSVYVLLRVIFTIFKPGFAFAQLALDVGLMSLSLLGIFAASVAAIFQKNVKRMLAYSSVAQIGYVVLGISFAESSVDGLTAGIVHLFNHGLIKAGLFMAVGCLVLRLGTVELSDLRGASRQMPWTMLAFALAGLGLVGVPATAGFVSKWYLLLGAIESGYWPVAVLILISSLLALIYIWRVIEPAYFGEVPEGKSTIREAPLSMLIPTYAVVAATLLFGIWTPLSVGIARRAAESLLGVHP
jgi:multicomponent Na+:H+ antiporter subunit D